jgi:uncharacterized membrane protein (UPF0136 family)
MKKTVWLVFLYAASVFIGGATGYIYSGSLPSLLSGVSFGSLLFLSSFFMYKKKAYGYWAAFSLAVILEGVFVWRFSKTLHLYPAGFLSALSLVVIVIVALKLGSEMRSTH